MYPKATVMTSLPPFSGGVRQKRQSIQTLGAAEAESEFHELRDVFAHAFLCSFWILTLGRLGEGRVVYLVNILGF